MKLSTLLFEITSQEISKLLNLPKTYRKHQASTYHVLRKLNTLIRISNHLPNISNLIPEIESNNIKQIFFIFTTELNNSKQSDMDDIMYKLDDYNVISDYVDDITDNNDIDYLRTKLKQFIS